jgi:hypothetical protein
VRRTSANLKLPLCESFRHDDGAQFGRWIHLYWSETSDHVLWIDFEIFEAFGCSLPGGGIGQRKTPLNGPPLFYATEARELGDRSSTTNDIDFAVPTVLGFVKWDGCTQIYFPNDGHVHRDDLESLAGLFSSICRAQARCYEIYEEQESKANT